MDIFQAKELNLTMKKLLKGGFVVTPRGSRRADVLLDGEKIAQVGHISPAEAKSAEVTDVSGCYLFPGFIDAHIHLESSLVTPKEFVRATLPHGTTTVITDPHEITNVMGTDGIDYMFQATEGLPIEIGRAHV